jgi:hypothetical protein
MINSWGAITDIKKTGLQANQGKTCPFCNLDSGSCPIRIDFQNHNKSEYFHQECANQLSNQRIDFFSHLARWNSSCI